MANVAAGAGGGAGGVATSGGAAGGVAAHGSAALTSASSAVPGVPVTVLNHALTAGFSTAFSVAGTVVLLGFVVALITTWTGHWRLSSAVTRGREQPCDEVLGTCEV
jgi:hypothetical protein